jgi:hypothetical protein
MAAPRSVRFAAARRGLRALFAGDKRVWVAAAAVGVPLWIVIFVWCAVPRAYFTGTNSVNTYTFVAQTPAGTPMCVPGLEVPAGTARIQLDLISLTSERPALDAVVRIGGDTVTSDLPARLVSASRISSAYFPIPLTHGRASAQPGSICVRAGGFVNWGGTTVIQTGFPPKPTVGGVAIGPARVAVRYLPPAGSRRSYLDQLGAIVDRASLFRPGIVGPWLYVLILLLVLPALAVWSVRLIALAMAGERRRYGAWLFAICAVNAICWSLITPAFQVPDEVDHFAYVASIATHLRSPDTVPSARARWSSAETDAIAATNFLTDHYTDDSRAPWLAVDVASYNGLVASTHPSDGDGGGLETAASHGPLYYLALAPGFLLAGAGHVFSQLGLARLISALIGSIAALCTYLMCLEFAPRKRWLAVLAALLVSFEPMYGFISGGVNNDVGINAGAAVLELLLLRIVTRGLTVRRALATGVVLALLPFVKGTAYSLYPVAALVFVVVLGRVLWGLRAAGRAERVAALRPWLALAAAAVASLAIWTGLLAPIFHSPTVPLPGGGSTGSLGVLAHPLSLLSLLWQVLLPRLPFMHAHFAGIGFPFRVIFVIRGFGAFGFYTILFPTWVNTVIEVVMYSTFGFALIATWRNRDYFRRHATELVLLVLTAAAVVAGFESQFLSSAIEYFVPTFGRYAFPAIGPLSILVVGSLYAFGRRAAPWIGVGLVVAMMALSYAGQLHELTAFFA